MKRIIFLVTTFMIFFSSAAYARVYQIGISHWIGCSVADVADVKGFWKDQGLEVKIINFNSSSDLKKALEYKRTDISYVMIGTGIGLYEEGVPVTALIETDWCHGGDKIVVRKDFDITRLKGSKIGTYNITSTGILFFLNKYLLSNNLKLSDIELVEDDAENLAASFIGKRLNVILTYDPQALKAEREGNGKIVATTATYHGCMPEGFASRTDVFKDIPKDDLVKIFKGWIEAVKWIQNKTNWEEYKKILNSRTFEGEPAYSDKDLADMYEGIRLHDEKMLLERNRDGGGLSVWITEAKAMLKENNMLIKDFKPEEIFDNTAIKEALKDVQ